MKIKMLFTVSHMGLGGAEKALVSLLNAIDYDRFEVDLQLIHARGFNLKYLPSQVNVLAPLTEGKPYALPFAGCVKGSLKKGRIDVVLRRIYYALIAAIKDPARSATTKYYIWRFMRKYIPESPKEYDVAVGYLDGTPHYYTIDKARAAKKICWVHNDYSKMPTCKQDFRYLRRADVVATVSPKCVEEIQRFFPQLGGIQLVYNLNAASMIRRQAQEPLGKDFSATEDAVRILSVGRLSEQKAYHFAIEASRMLKDKGYRFNWSIIGDGELRDTLTAQIKQRGVEDVFHLLGTKENPYPYMAAADIVVQCSIFEGKSIALDEAKILARPIVCTDYPSAKDQIEDGVTGLLVPINAAGVADGVERLLRDPLTRKTLSETLAQEDFDQAALLKQHENRFLL